MAWRIVPAWGPSAREGSLSIVSAERFSPEIEADLMPAAAAGAFRRKSYNAEPPRACRPGHGASKPPHSAGVFLRRGIGPQANRGNMSWPTTYVQRAFLATETNKKICFAAILKRFVTVQNSIGLIGPAALHVELLWPSAQATMSLYGLYDQV